MGFPVELIGKELLNGARAKLPGREADGMNDKQIKNGARGAWAKVGGLAFFSALAPALLPIVKAHGT